jgi:hypothetical protein
MISPLIFCENAALILNKNRSKTNENLGLIIENNFNRKMIDKKKLAAFHKFQKRMGVSIRLYNILKKK